MMNSKIDISKKFTLNRACELLICAFYTWYFLPICSVFFWGGRFKLLFFGCFLVGCLGLVLTNGIRLNAVMVAVASYMIFFSMLYLFGIDQAHRHIRISFTFWGTALLFFGLLDYGGKIRIGKYLFILFVFTAITSSVGVTIDNSAARVLTHAAADDTLQASYALRNISSINIFQGMVYFVPIAILLPKTGKQKLLGILLLATVLFVLFNASFTIALAVYVFAIVVSIMFSGNSRESIIWTEILIVAIWIVWSNASNVLTFLANAIDNYKITPRLLELSAMFSGEDMGHSVGLRWSHYSASLMTFFENPLGVGAFYSYKPFDNGIGYHSKLFDDLARFGILALAFYVVLFVGYYRHLKNEWQKVGCPQVAKVITEIYIVFLSLNLGFRSADESILLFFILPILPNLMQEWQNRKSLIWKGASA